MIDQASPNGAPGGNRRRAVSLALVASMAVGALGGGVVGSAATLYAVRQIPAAQSVLLPSAQPLTSASPATEAAPRTDAAQTTPIVNVREAGAITQVFRKTSPAVVSVGIGSARGPLGQFRQQGEGSGFVVDRSGLVLTNNHVVEGARRIVVRFSDGTESNATVMGTDPGTDLAVLKADRVPANQGIAALGDSDQVEPGQTAVAIGSPFGLAQTITAGIISAVNRDWGSAGGRPMRGLIQTDAPVNPGNSGGPLLNLQGEVIGITTAIESPVRGSVGIGFAIPSNEAKRLLPQLARGEQVDHPWLGISGTALTPELARQLNLSVQQGVLVSEAIADGPAAQAGLRGGRSTTESDTPVGGDVITAADGKAVGSVQELASYLDTRHVGDQVRLSVLRDGQTIEVPVTLGAWPVGARS
ncbi:MAG: trypsin-like peptidase domain-containing protein [Chloroflexi bacterium]|nr:trypsin-like peptidase domain-containing protein [Chloroflexota bacterium]